MIRVVQSAMLVGATLLIRSTQANAQTADTVGVRTAAREFVEQCHVGDRLWRRSLCGPLVIVDRATRTAIATQAPPVTGFVADGNLYVGQMQAEVRLANTAQRWGEGLWSFVLAPLPADSVTRDLLLFHESFHRIQPDLGLTRPDAVNAHLDQRDGRYWLRLELRALAAALRSTSPEAVQDALLFRLVRHRRFPGADSLEGALELAEGLAEYTGTRVALTLAGRPDSAAATAALAFETRPSYARSLGYGTGPALGLLLDRYRPDWRTRIASEGFASQLGSAVAWRPPESPESEARRRAAVYGGAAIAREEDARARAQQRVRDDYRRRLTTGRILVLEQKDLNLGFDPNALIPLDSLGTVYPTGTFSAGWGKLEVTQGGALVSPDFRRVRVPLAASADLSGETVEAPGWRLVLAPGWRVVRGQWRGEWTVKGER